MKSSSADTDRSFLNYNFEQLHVHYLPNSTYNFQEYDRCVKIKKKAVIHTQTNWMLNIALSGIQRTPIKQDVLHCKHLLLHDNLVVIYVQLFCCNKSSIVPSKFGFYSENHLRIWRCNNPSSWYKGNTTTMFTTQKCIKVAML